MGIFEDYNYYTTGINTIVNINKPRTLEKNINSYV